MNSVEIPLKLTGVGSMKAQLRSLKAEIANATDPEQMMALSEQAGVLADKIKDANDAVSVFASGSKFEQVSNSFSGIGDSIRSLDFEEANEKSKQFAGALGKISQTDVTGALKGITGMVKTMGGAFIKLGLQILANPLFLLVAVIVAIVVAIGVFLNKIGVLGKVLDFVMAPLNLLIEGFKWLTDTLGLTTYAAEENAVKMEAANEKAWKSSEKRAQIVGDSYDIEIAKAKANGKDTSDLELEKNKYITEASKKRLLMARAEYRYIKDLDTDQAIERRKKLKERIDKENDIVRSGLKERRLMEIQKWADNKKKVEENAKKIADLEKQQAEEAQKRYQDRLKKYKEGEDAILKEINTALKLVSDSKKTDEKREIDDTTAKYEALITEAKKYKKDTTALEEAKNLEISNIQKGYAEKEIEHQKALAEQLKSFQEEEAMNAENIQEINYQAGLTEQQKELEDLKYHYDALLAEANRYGTESNNIEEEYKKKKAEIDKKYADKEKAEALSKIEEAKKERDAKIQAVGDYANSIANLGALITNDQKKLEKINKASALVQIGIDTAKAISSLVAMSQSNPLNGITGGVAGAVQFASGILQITTNIAKAKQLLSNPSGNISGSGSGSSSGSSSVSSATPSIQMFGQGNNLNSAGGTKSVSANQNMLVTAVVSETDITSTQNKISKMQKNSEL